MVIKKFIAPTMPEALAKVKKELGEDAVILKTRMNKKGGAGNGKNVEVTAAVEKEQKPRFNVSNETVNIEPKESRIPGSAKTETQPSGDMPSEKLEQLSKEIANLKQSFSEQNKTRPAGSFFGSFSSEMLTVGRELMAKNLSEELAFKVVSRISNSEDGFGLDKNEIAARVTQTLCSMIPDGHPIRLKDNGPTVVMFIGMAGSGKTSAIARVATQFKVEQNRKVAIVTTDNYRADSSHQVKSFCRILGCPCGIVYTPEELSMAIKSQPEGLILVDTAGVSPNDDKELGELHSLIRAANLHELHLVAAASTPSRDIHRLISTFDEFGIDRILITKLDETQAPGGVITAAIESGKKLSYMSGSREIPGKFNIASSESLADILTSVKTTEISEPEWEMEAVGIWQ